jgi:hypothetical protein
MVKPKHRQKEQKGKVVKKMSVSTNDWRIPIPKKRFRTDDIVLGRVEVNVLAKVVNLQVGERDFQWNRLTGKLLVAATGISDPVVSTTPEVATDDATTGAHAEVEESVKPDNPKPVV